MGVNGMNHLKRNIKVEYVYKFLTSFDITAGIWVLYLGFKGLSLIEIGLLESIFHLTSLICEIPTGALADLLGRKKTIVMGRVCLLLSCIIMLFADQFWFFALAFIIQALGYNLNSGSEEALIYDSMKELGQVEGYLSLQGRLNLIIEMASGLAVFIGGMLADTSFSLSYILAILVAITSLGISLQFSETSLVDEKSQISFLTHFKTCYEILKQNLSLTGLLIFFPTICTFSTVIYFYGQQYFSEIGFTKTNIAVIFLFNGLISAIGALLVTKIETWLKGLAWFVVPILIGIAIIVFGLVKGVGSIVPFWLVSFFTAALWPISSNRINAHVPSEQRATIISISSMFFSLMMIILFPICGFIGQYVSLNFAFIIMGAIHLIFVLGVVLKYGKNKVS
ncbi:MAG TPA: MFS transporter [Firmicutes bacterium]|nr:MFS transporter [Bacillota bacterium]